MNLVKQILNKIPNMKFRTKLTGCIIRTNSTDDKSEYVTVYMFKHIQLFSMVNKLKLYQTMVTGISIPGSEILSDLGYLNNSIVPLTTMIGIAGCGAFYSIGYFTSKFIGFIYYNQEKNTTKISYVDFWGRRKDIEIPIEDLVPLSELPKTPLDRLYFTIRRFSTKDTFKLSLNYAEVLDSKHFNKIFE